jgi:glycosyltransferase involved in cell wall biosynthesis
MTQASISVIICAYNGGKYVGDAIISVINQSITPLEIIVVNDGSTDNTAEVIKSFGEKVKYIFKENQGLPAARNTGIIEARGNYITFLDQDDLYFEDSLEKQLAVFAKYKSVDVCAGHTIYTHLSKPNQSESPKASKKGFQILMGCTRLKKTVFDVVGLFDESLLMAEDVDMYLRIKEAGIPFAIHNNVVMAYRRHDSNITNNKMKAQLYFLRAIKKAKERRKTLPHDLQEIPAFNTINDAINHWHTAK